MTEVLFLLALLISPALPTYFFFGSPLKGLLPLAIASVLVIWYFLVALVILYKALESPATATEQPALGLNAS